MILMGDGVVANVVLDKTKGHAGGWMVVTTAWALAVFVGVVVAAPYSGAHLNPAVTFAFALTGQFPWERVLPYVSAQMIGAALGAVLVWLAYRPHFLGPSWPFSVRLRKFGAPAGIFSPS